jgi:hypothetical protein
LSQQRPGLTSRETRDHAANCLSGDFRGRLQSAISRERFTPELEGAIVDALVIEDSSQSRKEFRTRFEAAESVLTAIEDLRRAIERADAAWEVRRSPSIASKRCRLIHDAWGLRLTESLSVAESSISRWVEMRRPPKRRRGAPHYHEARVRYLVMAALQDASISLDEWRGPAAEVLAVVMEELDRLLGREPRERADLFKKSQWVTWVKEFREIDSLVREWWAARN